MKDENSTLLRFEFGMNEALFFYFKVLDGIGRVALLGPWGKGAAALICAGILKNLEGVLLISDWFLLDFLAKRSLAWELVVFIIFDTFSKSWNKVILKFLQKNDVKIYEILDGFQDNKTGKSGSFY